MLKPEVIPKAERRTIDVLSPKSVGDPLDFIQDCAS